VSRIAEIFAARKREGRAALVMFVTAGDPDLATTEALVPALVEAGVPFSDPLADGPTIQKSYERALRNDTSLAQIVGLVETLRPRLDAGLVLMGAYNPILKFGPDAFVALAAASGVDGVIVPDLPPEEGETFYPALEKAGVDPILLLAPTSTRARIELVTSRSRGFVYYVSLTGVTGAREALATDIAEHVGEIRAVSDLPVAVGFGISTPEHARSLAGTVDGVVVGSALVSRIAEAETLEARVEAAKTFTAALREGLDEGR